jgi:hypothetical protein
MKHDIESLRAEEGRCIDKFRRRAAKLRAATPRLSPSVAMAKAIESLPNCTHSYLQARSHLTMLGVRPLPLE